jgi:hypothetical protein
MHPIRLSHLFRSDTLHGYLSRAPIDHGAGVPDRFLTFEELGEYGWASNRQTGSTQVNFASVSFCLKRDGIRVKCVQGYGPTLSQAMADAVYQANLWMVSEEGVAAMRKVDD